MHFHENRMYVFDFIFGGHTQTLLVILLFSFHERSGEINLIFRQVVV